MAQLEAVAYKDMGGLRPYTPGSAATAGTVLERANGEAGVVATDLAANQLGEVYTTGLFKFKKASAKTFTDGEAAYWDASADTTLSGDADTIETADFYVGTVELDAAAGGGTSGDTFVIIDLNKLRQPQSDTSS